VFSFLSSAIFSFSKSISPPDDGPPGEIPPVAPAPLPTEPELALALPAEPVPPPELAVPSEFVPGAELPCAPMVVPLGLFHALLMLPALPGPTGTPHVPADPAPADPAEEESPDEPALDAPTPAEPPHPPLYAGTISTLPQRSQAKVRPVNSDIPGIITAGVIR
jgi:hypothetical protein